nr:hypothetical protein Itr_chr14CG20200 [Ipomoea trifida]
MRFWEERKVDLWRLIEEHKSRLFPAVAGPGSRDRSREEDMECKTVSLSMKSYTERMEVASRVKLMGACDFCKDY